MQDVSSEIMDTNNSSAWLVLLEALLYCREHLVKYPGTHR